MTGVNELKALKELNELNELNIGFPIKFICFPIDFIGAPRESHP